MLSLDLYKSKSALLKQYHPSWLTNPQCRQVVEMISVEQRNTQTLKQHGCQKVFNQYSHESMFKFDPAIIM